MPWIVAEGRVLASADLATDRSSRTRGLLGRDHFEGALVLRPCRWIHTLRMKFPIDVAYLDGDGIVVKTLRMRRGRLGIPVWHARAVVEAEAGAFARWVLRDAMFPRSEYAQAWERISAELPERAACRAPSRSWGRGRARARDRTAGGEQNPCPG